MQYKCLFVIVVIVLMMSILIQSNPVDADNQNQEEGQKETVLRRAKDKRKYRASCGWLCYKFWRCGYAAWSFSNCKRPQKCECGDRYVWGDYDE